jgi:O-succinylhomoserine sulfhydrylase
MLKGLETLDLRCRAQAATAQRLAEQLRGTPAVARVLYPGLPDHPQATLAARQMETGGTVVAIDILGGKEAAFRFLDRLQIVLISNNLGDTKSLVTHPATTTHQRLTPQQRSVLGIGDGLVRLSVGLEDPDDLLADLEGALTVEVYAK